MANKNSKEDGGRRQGEKCALGRRAVSVPAWRELSSHLNILSLHSSSVPVKLTEDCSSLML